MSGQSSGKLVGGTRCLGYIQIDGVVQQYAGVALTLAVRCKGGRGEREREDERARESAGFSRER